MKKAILIVSFGTTYSGTREKNIHAITAQVKQQYPDVIVEEAVTSPTVRSRMKENEGITAHSPAEGLTLLCEQGVTHVVIFPTHVIDGIENNGLKDIVKDHVDLFTRIEIADVLLKEQSDYEAVAAALWESVKDEVGDSALVLMGHGTEHDADGSYMRIEQAMRAYAGHQVYVATVEGSVRIEDRIAHMQANCTNRRVVVLPFMLVAGDHATNDMAGETDSFASKLRDAGFEPECHLRGLGEYEAVRAIYLSHLHEAMRRLDSGSYADRKGELYGIGVGCGNPRQMTLEAIETIHECDVIVLPAVSAGECIAYRIAVSVCPELEHKRLLCMQFPMIKDEGKLELAHRRIYDDIEKELSCGYRVGFLTIGDPGIYSTYMYIHGRASAAGWKSAIINGVPSFCSVAASLGISLGEKNEQIHIIPASYDVKESLALQGTRVYMKSGKRLSELINVLREQNVQDSFQVYGVSDCGMAGERIYHDLDELEAAEGYLTTVVVKEK